MYKKRKILAVITARGGSQRLPKKNILPLAGKPLIAWSIDAAKKSQYIDETIVSSDCGEIIEEAKEYGANVPFKRPDNLATATTNGIDPVKHAYNFMKNELQKNYDYVILLQPTSPFRSAEDIDNAIELLINNEKNNVNSIVSVVEPDKKIAWHYYLDDNKQHKLQNILSKKNIPSEHTAYCLNGAIYIIKSDVLMSEECDSFIDQNTIGYVMTKEHSVDIDSELDFKFCELLLAEGVIKNDH